MWPSTFFCFINALLTAETQRHEFQRPTSRRQQAQANEYLRQRPSRKKRLSRIEGLISTTHLRVIDSVCFLSS